MASETLEKNIPPALWEFSDEVVRRVPVEIFYWLGNVTRLAHVAWDDPKYAAAVEMAVKRDGRLVIDASEPYYTALVIPPEKPRYYVSRQTSASLVLDEQIRRRDYQERLVKFGMQVMDAIANKAPEDFVDQKTFALQWPLSGAAVVAHYGLREKQAAAVQFSRKLEQEHKLKETWRRQKECARLNTERWNRKRQAQWLAQAVKANKEKRRAEQDRERQREREQARARRREWAQSTRAKDPIGLYLNRSSAAVLQGSTLYLWLTPRTDRLLERQAGIYTIAELTNQTAQDLMKIPRFGTKSLQEVEEALADVGLKLKPLDNATPTSDDTGARRD